MKRWRALRALARVEIRELRRHPRRSLLVLLLVAVPVAAVVGGATLAHITEPTLEERRIQATGRADLRLDGLASYDDIEDAVASLGADSATLHIERIFVGVDEVAVPGTRLRARLFATRPEALANDGLAQGMVVLRAGRAPRHAGEVALSPALIEALGREPGDRVTLEFGAERTITGVVVDPEQLDAPLIVRAPAAVEHLGRHSLLVAAPPDQTGELAGRARAHGATVTVRDEIVGRSDSGTLIFALGTIGFAEAALVIGAAFAVGMRRRRREIGLVAAAGATVGGVWVSLLVSAAVVAAMGGVVGVVLGGGAVAALHPWLDGWNQRQNGPFELVVGHALAGLVLGVVTGVLAAALPARGVAKLPIRVALGGRRAVRGDSQIWLRLGVPLVVVGFLATSLSGSGHRLADVAGVVVGPILGLVGFGLCSPWLLDVLARRAAPLPLAWRLAVRDAGRFRTRNGPVVTAVLAGMAMSMTIAILVHSIGSAIELIPASYRDDHLVVEGADGERVAREVADDRSAVASAPLSIATVGGEPVRARFAGSARPFTGQTIAVGDLDLLRVLAAESAREAFEAGELIALDPPSEPAEVELSTWVGERPLDPLPIHSLELDQRLREPAFLLHHDVAERLGWEPGPPIRRTISPWFLRLGSPVTAEDLASARRLAADSAGAAIDAAALQQRPAIGFYYVVLGLCVLTGMVIVLIANALTAAESADDERVLHTIGASPSLVRRHGAARAGYLALLGCVLAVPAGLLPTRGLVAAAELPMELVVPWQAVLATLFALPLVAWLAAWLLAGRAASVAYRALVVAVALLGAVGFTSETSATEVSVDSAAGAPAAGAPVGTVRWSPFVGEAFDGSPLPGELGRLNVPADHRAPDGATIELAFVRYRTSRPDAGPPIVFLAGGPGGAGSELGGKLATHPQIRLLEHRDVLAIDQRGTGLGTPDLMAEECPPDLPLDRAVSRDELLAALGRAAAECADRWTARGIDLTTYDTRQSADDIDAVRRALGLDRIALYGGSYGSHLGLAYLRRHGEHVERAVLSRVEGPDDTWKLPSAAQAGLERVAAWVRESPTWSPILPDLVGLVRELLERLEAQPVRVTISATDGSGADRSDADRSDANRSDADRSATVVEMAAYDLALHVAYALGSVDGQSRLPAELHAMAGGDWSTLAESTITTRRLAINAMTLAMDCRSGGSSNRQQRIERERLDPRNLLVDAGLAPFYPQLCEAAGLPMLDDAFRTPITSDVPVLFLSGGLDIRTPPANVEAMRRGFSRHVHLLADHAAHSGRELMAPEARRTIQAFLRGEAVTDITVALPRPRLEPPVASRSVD